MEDNLNKTEAEKEIARLQAEAYAEARYGRRIPGGAIERVQVEERKRIDWKARYFTMRGYVVILAVALAAVVFGVAVRGFFK